MRAKLPLTALALSASLLLPTAVVAQGATCWDNNIGQDLGLIDDSLATGLVLPFNFPLPGGGTTNSIDVCSNGYVWLVSGSSTAADYTPTVAELLADPARLAPAWTDLNPTQGGSVHFTASAASAVITWKGVPEFLANGRCTMQLQLYPSGAFVLAYRELPPGMTHDLFAGVSAGNGATDPGEVDLSSAPLSSSGVPVLYELFTNGVDPLDLVGSGYYFIPDGSGGYNVVPLSPCSDFQTYGQACPQQPVFYEQFDGPTSPNDLSGISYLLSYNGRGGYAVTVCQTSCFEPNFQNNLGLADDQLATGLQLGFPFPLAGASVATTTTIDVDSNGWIGLVSGAFTGSDFSEDVAQFLDEPERLAVYWDDLSPNSAGGVYADAMPGKFVVTWSGVPEFLSSSPNTFQAQLFPSGDIILHYAAGNAALDGLVGYSPGNGLSDPGSIDLTSMVPFDQGLAGTPIVHTIGGSPTPGTSMTLRLSGLTSSMSVAFMNFGVSRTSIDLSLIGMPGCMLLASIEATLPMQVATPTASVSFRLPTSTNLIGANFYTQGIVVAPGTTALGLLASNGGLSTVGL